MFPMEPVRGMDDGDVCEAIAAAHQDLLEVETRQLLLAAHWVDLNALPDEPDAEPSRRLPGRGRPVRVGADGTPEIDEFACAEFAMLQDMHPRAGAGRLARVANLVHRHPRLWVRVDAGEVRGWKALEVAKETGKATYGLTREQARWVDEQTYEWIDTLPWGQFLNLLEAKIIACDAEAAEARRRQAQASQYVATGQCNEYGLKTLIAQAEAGDVIFLSAMVDRIAKILADQGDTRTIGARRARALGVLGTPALATAMLEEDARKHAEMDTPDDAAESSGDAAAEPDLEHRENPDLLHAGDLHPADDEGPGTSAGPCPTCGGVTPEAAAAAGFVRPSAVDLGKLLPKATLYIHVTQHGFQAGRGVCRIEGVGPVTIGQAQEFLGHCNVRVIPVVDLAEHRSVDGYEFPASIREQVHLITPRDVFPFAASTSRAVDFDHPFPYLPPGKGGPPGQTHPGNAAPMVRFHHRLKAHGRWGLRQPDPRT